MIYTYIKKPKAKKPTAKQRELKSSWEDILAKYETKPVKKVQSKSPEKYIREGSDSRVYASLDTGVGIAPKPADKVYTGDAMIGVGQLHKSNAIPVFSKEDAIDVARMRR